MENLIDANQITEGKTIVWASYSPQGRTWTGKKCIQGVAGGTHDTYDMIYNGECNNECFDTEQEAKAAAEKATK